VVFVRPVLPKPLFDPESFTGDGDSSTGEND